MVIALLFRTILMDYSNSMFRKKTFEFKNLDEHQDEHFM